jgi:hypothetical protein
LSATQVARVEERRNFRDYSGGGGTAPSAHAAGFGSLGDVLRKQLGLPTAETPSEKPKRPEAAPARAADSPAAPPKQNDAVIRRKR